jgi:HD-GYP domain-containing protein (c-di-GMP phosphodiesterase class II)
MKTAMDTQTIVDIIKGLTSALANSRMYFPEHPQVKKQIDAAHGEILKALNVVDEITLIRVADEIIVLNTPVRSKDITIEKFSNELARCGISRITFQQGISDEEVAQWVMDMVASGDTGIRSTLHIQVGKIEIPKSASTLESLLPMEAGRRLEAELFYDTKLIEIRRLYEGILGGQALNPVDLERIVFAFARVFEKGTNPLRLLAFLRTFDEYTYTHVANVFILTMSLAEAIGIEGGQLVEIGIASLMHDMGKLFIPSEVLNKPSKLSDEEWMIVQSHTIRGAAYLMGIKGIPRVAVLAALEHHIRYNGSGYPHLGENYQPHLVSQMVAITDAFDAMRSRRSYQDAKPMDFILNVLNKERGVAFNPMLVDAFINMMSD